MSKDQLINELMSLLLSGDELENKWWVPWDDVLKTRQQFLTLLRDNPCEFGPVYTRSDYIEYGVSEVNRVQKKKKLKSALLKVASAVVTVTGSLLAVAAAGSSNRPLTSSAESRMDGPTPARKFTIMDYDKPDVVDGLVMFPESQLEIENYRLEGDSDFTAINRMNSALIEAQEDHDLE